MHRSLLLALLLVSLPANVLALFVAGSQSTESRGRFEAEIVYTPLSALEAELRVTLTNTTDPAEGGFITAFAMNNPDGRIRTLEPAVALPPEFALLGAASALKAQPFGTFDFGAALGGSFLGGGAPTMGIAPGQTMEFVLLLRGEGLDEIDEFAFAEALSDVGRKDHLAGFFAARFKGFEDGGSDKVLGGLGGMVE